MGAEAIVQCVDELVSGTLPPAQAQDHDQATYAHKLAKAEATIDWSQPAAQIERQIRAFNPWPGSQTELQGEALKIWSAAAMEGADRGAPGQVIQADKSTLVVQCGEGHLQLLELQKAGKKRMPVDAFMASRAAWYQA
jgi:methionyl-tRNA formyltransferase